MGGGGVGRRRRRRRRGAAVICSSDGNGGGVVVSVRDNGHILPQQPFVDEKMYGLSSAANE